MLQANKEKSFGLYAHMFLGIENGSSTKWLAQMDNIVFRYVYGRAEYEITDPSFDGTIYITYTRTDRFDGFLTKITLPRRILATVRVCQFPFPIKFSWVISPSLFL